MHQPQPKKQQEHREKCQRAASYLGTGAGVEAEDAEGVGPGKKGEKKKNPTIMGVLYVI